MPDDRQRVLISFVLCSRNDQHQGDSLWRLGTALNYLARQLSTIGRLDAAEIVVADWGSAEPLRDVTVLTDEARRIVRFLTVPVELTQEKQRDSPFAEVIAINAAARRARGEYIGRIDQDTLVGRPFLEWFFDRAEHPDGDASVESTVMISNRRRIPYHLAVRTPRFPIVERYVDTFGNRFLPLMEKAPAELYWEVYIGIILFHRKLWDDCEGYDETFIYYGAMESDLFLRLLTKYRGLDIGPMVGHSFHHLDHVPAWKVGRKLTRRMNPLRRPGVDEPETMQPNGPDWGLNAYDLPLEASRAPVRLVGDDRRWRPSDRAPLAVLTAVSTIRTFGQIGHGLSRQTLGRFRRHLRPART
jgi:hypothetical protein